MSTGEVGAFAQVIGIDILLAGDNAIAIGALAAGLTPKLRQSALLIGIACAVLLRIIFSLGVSWVFALPGAGCLGGAALLYVAWKLSREIANGADGGEADSTPLSFRASVAAIVATDVSLSLDNVIGVAGAARGHPAALIVGLTLSVLLMGAAATFFARIIDRHRWVARVGVVLIAAIGMRMILDDLLILIRPI